jgi:purine-binding chemotaxis protein CheW
MNERPEQTNGDRAAGRSDDANGARAAFVLFELAGTTYAVPADAVQHMDMITQITPVPNAASYLEGIVLSRGQVLPAISLRVRFGLPKIPTDERARLLVLRAAGRTLGLIVDRAREFVWIPTDALNPPPEAVAETPGHFLTGIAMLGDRMVLALDIDALLASADVPAGSAAPAAAEPRTKE